MRIYKNKNYEVMVFEYTEDKCITSDAGMLSGEDVKAVLKSAKYDEVLRMYVSKREHRFFWVQEVER